jgi:hypothetical protein
MKLGDYIHKGNGATYSPTFPRGGLAALFTASVLQLVGTPTLLISVEHKNEEDTTFTNLGAFANITTASNATLDLTGIKEQVRFVYTITATQQWEGVLLLMTAPAWRPY